MYAAGLLLGVSVVLVLLVSIKYQDVDAEHFNMYSFIFICSPFVTVKACNESFTYGMSWFQTSGQTSIPQSSNLTFDCHSFRN